MSGLIIRDIEQGSDEWFALRAGIPTASEFAKIYTATGKASTSADTYMYNLLAEWLIGPQGETYTNEHMERGKELEDEARDNYVFLSDNDVEQITFAYKDERRLVGCSPDGLIGNDGLLEIKCPAPHTHVKYLLGEKLPTNYVSQVQGQLWVTGRKWCDFLSYHPNAEPLLVRVLPDEKWQKGFEAQIDKFIEKMLVRRAKLDPEKAAA